MAMLDERIRFTEEAYATKEEVGQAYNTSLIDSIWDRIIKYRSLYSIDLNLRNIDKSPFNLTLTKTLQARISSCERKIVKIFIKYDKLNEEKKKEFNEMMLLRFFKELTPMEENVSLDMLRHIIRKDISAFPTNLYPLYYYSSSWQYFLNHFYDNIDSSLLARIYKMIIGEEDENVTEVFRKEELETPHYYQTDYIYKAAPTEELPRLVEELVNFARQDNLSPLLKGIISIFYIKYIKPFGYCNEEVASIFSKFILSKDDFDKAGFFIIFESLAFDNSENSKNLMNLVQKTLDMTYYVMHYFSFIEDDVSYILDILISLEGKQVEEECNENNDIQENEIKIKTVSPTIFYKPETSEVNNIPSDLKGKSEVALPVFPSGVDSNAVEGIVENLLEVYPYLKRNQAHFYASHCTIGKHYTIAQYKKEEGVAYETARTSMDFLADQGFYKKSQVRNKFVYTPIPRR
ncbi:MAG TPA: hypothetical protein DCY93_02375 [Firmicutes bacterium]|nr:hypothetical protein [Bacillota bacterium]